MTGSGGPPVAIEPRGAHRASVIWLHGLGADGRDFLPVVAELDLPDALGIRFVFPEAPLRPVTLNGGLVMRAWFDIEISLAGAMRMDEAQLMESVTTVRRLAASERAAGIPSERIVLAGFSQGGSVVLHEIAGPRDRTNGGEPPPASPGATIALSTRLPRPDNVLRAPDDAGPIFAGHGTADPMIPFREGDASARALARAGWDVDFRAYPMGHMVSGPEIADLGAFLRRVLAPTDRPGAAAGA